MRCFTSCTSSRTSTLHSPLHLPAGHLSCRRQGLQAEPQRPAARQPGPQHACASAAALPQRRAYCTGAVNTAGRHSPSTIAIKSQLLPATQLQPRLCGSFCSCRSCLCHHTPWLQTVLPAGQLAKIKLHCLVLGQVVPRQVCDARCVNTQCVCVAPHGTLILWCYSPGNQEAVPPVKRLSSNFPTL
jgi:hypothetical protein